MRSAAIVLTALATVVMTAAAADTAAGQYELRGVREMGSELLLRPDGTFEFMLIYGAADYSSKGAWKRDGQSVVLNTIGAAQAPFRLVRSAKTSAQDMVQVVIKGANGRPVPNIDVRLTTTGGDLEARTGSDGIAAFPPSTVRSAILSVRVYQIEAGPYALDPRNNEFQFEINGEAITQVRFENERVRIVGSALELRHFNPSEPMMYYKQGRGE